jgi:prefoldin subunit 5
MPKTVTVEKRKEYEAIIDNFHEKRDEIKKTIKGHQLVINKKKEEISKLEKEIQNLKPIIEG